MNALDEAQLTAERAREAFEARHGEAPWMEEYWTLLAEGWPWRQAVYMLWAAMPADRREPRTQGELATTMLGLTSDRQIREWRQNNPGIDVRVGQLTRAALLKARPRIYGALIDAASNPNPRAHADRKLALEMLGDYTPRSIIQREGLVDDLSAVPEDELAATAAVPGNVGDAGGGGGE